MVERSMQGINKITAIVSLRRDNWKEALADYVAAYNSWPHHVTKIPPAELMFGRPIRGLLPDIRTDQQLMDDSELRERDQAAKFNRNIREDIRRGAGSSEISIGDKVLVSRQKRDKADSVYKNALHEVVKITGEGRATITDLTSSKTFDRNVKHLKRFRERSQEKMTTGRNKKETPGENTHSTGQNLDGCGLQGEESPIENVISCRGETVSKRRAARIIKRPQRYVAATNMLPDLVTIKLLPSFSSNLCCSGCGISITITTLSWVTGSVRVVCMKSENNKHIDNVELTSGVSAIHKFLDITVTMEETYGIGYIFLAPLDFAKAAFDELSLFI
ncbi:uncharacterized protein LOC134221851 [Armigeres subalbatus]|uniref:uncharacterized protein LOC134221851 n=1 Tax=Armigeres subalbatus TaxID=124917 RepID=UPI002ED31980